MSRAWTQIKNIFRTHYDTTRAVKVLLWELWREKILQQCLCILYIIHYAAAIIVSCCLVGLSRKNWQRPKVIISLYVVKQNQRLQNTTKYFLVDKKCSTVAKIAKNTKNSGTNGETTWISEEAGTQLNSGKLTQKPQTIWGIFFKTQNLKPNNAFIHKLLNNTKIWKIIQKKATSQNVHDAAAHLSHRVITIHRWLPIK